MGNIHILHAGLYESSHRLFKAMYQKTTKRTASASDEAIKWHKKAAKLVIEGSRSRTSEIAGAVRRHGSQIDRGLLA